MMQYEGLDVVCAYCGQPVEPHKVENVYYTYCSCSKGIRHRYEFLGLTAKSSFAQFCQNRRAVKLIDKGKKRCQKQ